MKKATIVALGVLVLAITASVWAAEDTTSAPDSQKQVRPDRPRPEMTEEQMEMRKQIRDRGMPGRPNRDPNAMRQMMEDNLERRKQEHQAAMNELKEIKKIAEGEKAVKTAEAIQKMIDTREAAFKKQTNEIEKKRAEMKERIEQRKQEAGQGRERPRHPKGEEGKDKD